jgi:hypothetical protein
MLSTAKTEIGRIITTLTITNRADQILATRGIITADEVRSITLNNVLVDTGATTLCLPKSTRVRSYPVGNRRIGIRNPQRSRC